LIVKYCLIESRYSLPFGIGRVIMLSIASSWFLKAFLPRILVVAV